MSIFSRNTKERQDSLSMRKFFFECRFDDILNTNRLLRVARYARESTNHPDQLQALNNQAERLDSLIKEHIYKGIGIRKGVSQEEV